MGRLLFTIEKLLYVLIGLGVVVWFLLKLNEATFGWKTYFLRLGDIQMVIFITVAALVLKVVFEKLLRWEVRQAFGLHERRPRVRRRPG